MKYLFGLVVLLLVSCGQPNDDSAIISNSNIIDMSCTPVGAEYIKSIKSNCDNCGNLNWVIWKLYDQCFISYALCYSSAIVNTIDCSKIPKN